MLLAVAGLSEEEIQQRTGKLAAGAWSDFPPAERMAFQFAYKLAREPWTVGDDDVRELVTTFGPHRAADLIWYGAWCNYMTRVADAFQLPLERENIFKDRQGERSGATEKTAIVAPVGEPVGANSFGT